MTLSEPALVALFNVSGPGPFRWLEMLVKDKAISNLFIWKFEALGCSHGLKVVFRTLFWAYSAGLKDTRGTISAPSESVLGIGPTRGGVQSQVVPNSINTKFAIIADEESHHVLCVSQRMQQIKLSHSTRM